MILRVDAPSPTNGQSLSSYLTDVICVYENGRLGEGPHLIDAIWVNSFGANANILLDELQKRYGTEIVRYSDR